MGCEGWERAVCMYAWYVSTRAFTGAYVGEVGADMDAYKSQA